MINRPHAPLNPGSLAGLQIIAIENLRMNLNTDEQICYGSVNIWRRFLITLDDLHILAPSGFIRADISA